MQNIFSKLGLLLFMIAISFNANAQKDTTKLNLNQVEVVKAFEANLATAERVAISPVMPTKPAFEPIYTYDITIIPFDIKYPDPIIKPLAMNADEPYIVKNGYIQAAYGLLKNPAIMAGYHKAKKDTYNAGIHLDYTALDNTKNTPLQKYSDLNAGVYGSYLIKENMAVDAQMKVGTQRRYFYHTDLGVDTLFAEADSKRNITNTLIEAAVRNVERTSLGLDYRVGVSLGNTSMTNTQISESSSKIMASVSKYFGDKAVLDLKGSYEYTGLEADTSHSLNVVNFKPTLKVDFDKLSVVVGVDYLYGSRNQSSLFPEIAITYALMAQKIQVFARVGQDHFINSITNTYSDNPYINGQLDSLTMSVTKSMHGGVKGNFSFLRYEVSGGYKMVARQQFLLNNRTDLRYFDRLVDDMNVLFISGNVEFVLTDQIIIGGRLTQNFYDLATLSNAWHLPNLVAAPYFKTQLLNNKLNITGELYFNDNVDYLDKAGNITKSNVLFDFNLSASYDITPDFKVFINGINLFDNKFERWYGYPSVGFNAQVGARLIF